MTGGENRATAPSTTMQTIHYQHRPVALATAERFWLLDDVEALPAGDPLKNWACLLCLYARDVLTGQLPGPYTPGKAAFFARACLMPDADFLPVAHVADARLAAYFNVPLEQIAERRLDTTNPTREL